MNGLKMKEILPLIVLAAIILCSVFAPFLATNNPFEPNMAIRLQAPCSEHFFGTDAIGRDMFSRILYGGRTSLLLSLAGAVLSLTFGLVFGMTGGYFGGRFDAGLTVVTNIFQGLPGSSFMIAIVGILGAGIESLVLGLVITSWASFSRIVRAEVLKLKEEAFIEGLRVVGCSDWRIIICHILLNLTDKLLVLFMMRVGRGVLSVAGLSFIGLGVQPPTPDWSVMISDAMLYYRSAPHLIVIPGLCIFSLIYSLNSLGDSLRERLDVRFSEVRRW